MRDIGLAALIVLAFVGFAGFFVWVGIAVVAGDLSWSPLL